MINIWQYNIGDNIQIKCTNNTLFEGFVADIIDIGERSDLERQEDGITILTSKKEYIEIYQSEIKNISLLPEKAAG